ncbi:MAG TPA: ATP-dependent Clp protease ATP-binding subunit ClpA, partial [Albitalea sp.]|uniref:ATP-dependent Clp protease ATP-binding subunit ClpA n=1 Tax=Piscinibacter sp. TaxID=1903157 RepID=UPI002ED4FB71
MIAQELEVSLHMAFVEARQQRHEFITVEHLLMALLDNPSAAEVLRACSANIDDLRKSLLQFIKENTPTVGGSDEVDTQPTLGFQRVIQRAIMHVQSTGSGKKEVTGANVLVAIFGEKDSHAVYYLHQQGVTRLDVVNFIAHGIKKSDPPEPAKSQDGAGAEGEKEEGEGKGSPLDQFTQNLNQMARDGKIDPLIGRELEVERVIQILCRRRKNNPLLVGEAGVGKTAIAEGLAWRITQGDVPEVLANATVYALDMGALLAGTKYRGDFEQRLKGVLKHLKDQPNSVLFIDEIHTLIGAGAASGGTLDASNLLKPALSSGTMKCIGATTFSEYRGIFEKDAALSRRFQKIDVVEPSVEQTVEILKGLKSRFEEHHSVKYALGALQAAAELSAKFINDRHLPDKAIDVIDEAGAAQRILPKNKQKKTITRSEVEEIVAKIARIPPASVSSDDRSKLKSLDRDLNSVVFGQEPAIEALASAIKMARSGLGKPDKPIGSFLFSGPTGVGKTEVARQLAYILGIELIRFDMSEYMERHAVSRLIGAPPGYVGFDQGGLLTEAITKKPHAVLLLDEIEKAHPDVFNTLLQLLDDGRLTDAQGRTVDFRNTVVIMTSNIGSVYLLEGITSSGEIPEDVRGQVMADLRGHFRPEFLNRVDDIVLFKPLTLEEIEQIVHLQFAGIRARLADRRLTLDLTAGACSLIAREGYDPVYGARPLRRFIQREV